MQHAFEIKNKRRTRILEKGTARLTPVVANRDLRKGLRYDLGTHTTSSYCRNPEASGNKDRKESIQCGTERKIKSHLHTRFPRSQIWCAQQTAQRLPITSIGRRRKTVVTEPRSKINAIILTYSTRSQHQNTNVCTQCDGLAMMISRMVRADFASR